MSTPALTLPDHIGNAHNMLTGMGCVHHWRIETPRGQPTVAALCRRCGANRTFPAGIDDPNPWRKF